MKKSFLFFTVVISLFFAVDVFASTIIVSFSGEGMISKNINPSTGIAEGVGETLPVQGYFVYETETPSWANSLPNLEQYWPLSYHLLLGVGEYEWKYKPFEDTGIIITDGSFYDLFQLRGEGVLFHDASPVYDDSFFISSSLLLVSRSNAIDSTKLPNKSDLEAFAGHLNLNFSVNRADYAQVFKLTALNMQYEISESSPTPTPIPGAIYLLGSGLFGLFFVRRKKNK